MPRRLPVVVSQSLTGSAARRHIEESLITSLLLEPGLDLNVVPHIAELTADETGRLCLEGIHGPMVLVSWLAPGDAQAALTRLGIEARLGRTRLGGEHGQDDSSGTRTVYAIDLSGCESPERVCAEVRRIRDDLATPTVSILGIASPAAAQARSAAEPTASVTSADSVSASSGKVVPPASIAGDVENTDDDPALERLLDMLDEMDL